MKASTGAAVQNPDPKGACRLPWEPRGVSRAGPRDLSVLSGGAVSALCPCGALGLPFESAGLFEDLSGSFTLPGDSTEALPCSA